MLQVQDKESNNEFAEKFVTLIMRTVLSIAKYPELYSSSKVSAQTLLLEFQKNGLAMLKEMVTICTIERWTSTDSILAIAEEVLEK